jgi:hypothetical protein
VKIRSPERSAIAEASRAAQGNPQQYYDEALKIWPDDPVLLASKADLCQALGELDQADALLAKIHPTTENSAGLYGIAYQAILRRQPTRITIRTSG